MTLVLVFAAFVAVVLMLFALRTRSRWIWILAALSGSLLMVATLGAIAAFVFFAMGPATAPEAGDAAEAWPRHDVSMESGFAGISADGDLVVANPVDTTFEVAVLGDVADVHVKQVFTNPSDAPLSGTYMFPMYEDAAVYAMVYEVGDERVEAKIQRRDEAEATFERAKAEGKSASLTVQHRPNVFTQSIANVPARGQVRVTLHYTHRVPRRDGAYVLTVPTRVGDRYVPADMSKNTLGGHAFEFPAADIDAGAVRVEGVVAMAHPLEALPTASDVRIGTLGDRGFRFEASPGRPGADIEVRWQAKVSAANVQLTTAYDAANDVTYFSGSVEPPRGAVASETLREVVFLLDCSGSMMGDPLDASKAFMNAALDGLKPSDTFRVIRFSDEANEFSSVPLPASPDNLARARTYIDGLNSEGGTQMTSGIRQALEAPADGRLRLVVFLTDGYIGNDFDVIRLAGDLRGDARLYMVGVGDSVNRYLMQELAAMGRGRAEFLQPGPGVVSRGAALAAKIQTPVLTGLELALEDAEMMDMYPAELPDLFAGQAVHFVGRVHGRWEGAVALRAGDANVGRAQSSHHDEHADLISRTWARERISALQRALLKSSSAEQGIVEEITQIGLQWSLVTPWTSFVAVSNNTVRQPAWTPPTVHGTPEPTTLLGGGLAALLGWWQRRRRAR